jgi:hypothetical protein
MSVLSNLAKVTLYPWHGNDTPPEGLTAVSHASNGGGHHFSSALLECHNRVRRNILECPGELMQQEQKGFVRAENGKEAEFQSENRSSNTLFKYTEHGLSPQEVHLLEEKVLLVPDSELDAFSAGLKGYGHMAGDQLLGNTTGIASR